MPCLCDPFSVRTWSRADYNQMFHLLKRLGFDTVMLWPVVEAVTVPLSDTDAKAVRGFRFTITDAQRAGLESLVGWWKINGYVFDGVGTEEFRWHFAETSQVVALQQWCAQNVKDVAAGDLAVKQLVARNVLPEQVARARVRELLDR